MQITVENVEYPAEGRKTGSIKAGGRFYKAWPDKLDQFEIGMTYEVEVEQTEYQGKPQNWIKKKPKLLVRPTTELNAASGYTAGPATAPPRPNYASTIPNTHPTEQGFQRPAKDDELITRLAILKSLIESGALLQGEQSMDDLVEMAWTTAPKLKVWQR